MYIIDAIKIARRHPSKIVRDNGRKVIVIGDAGTIHFKEAHVTSQDMLASDWKVVPNDGNASAISKIFDKLYRDRVKTAIDVVTNAGMGVCNPPSDKQQDYYPCIEVSKERRETVAKLTESIVHWSKTMLPDTNETGQLVKLSDEAQEFEDANGCVHELVDVVIVCLGLQRWNNPLGRLLASLIFSSFSDEAFRVFVQDVEHKMKRNWERTWKIMPTGEYQHEEKQND